MEGFLTLSNKSGVWYASFSKTRQGVFCFSGYRTPSFHSTPSPSFLAPAELDFHWVHKEAVNDRRRNGRYFITDVIGESGALVTGNPGFYTYTRIFLDSESSSEWQIITFCCRPTHLFHPIMQRSTWISPISPFIFNVVTNPIQLLIHMSRLFP